MSDTPSKPSMSDLSPEEKNSLLFVQMVFQLSGLAAMLMGKTPHPETGKTTRDLESARMLIDQLEMLEIKTKGNLTADEAEVLRQNLTNLRLAFVEAVEHPEKTEAAAAKEPQTDAPSAPAESTGDSESKVKFSKKY